MQVSFKNRIPPFPALPRRSSRPSSKSRPACHRLLRTLVTDERNIVSTGDRVWSRPALND